MNLSVAAQDLVRLLRCYSNGVNLPNGSVAPATSHCAIVGLDFIAEV